MYFNGSSPGLPGAGPFWTRIHYLNKLGILQILHTKFQAPEPSSSGKEDITYILFSNPRRPLQGHFHLNSFDKGPPI